MADPAPATAPDPTTPDSGPPSPTKTKPVVLATVDHITEFVVPADRDEHGNPTGDDLLITHVGVPLTGKQADHAVALAAQYGVRLTDITPKD